MNPLCMEPAGRVGLFTAAALLVFYLPGAAWRWGLARSGLSSPRRRLEATAESLLLSLVVALPVVLLLGATGWFRPSIFRAIMAGVAIAGAIVGARRALGARMAEALPGAAVVALLLAGGYILPDRGEWILGGWDPGVYMNEGIRLSRTGSFTPQADPCHMFPGDRPEWRDAWTRRINGQAEAFPGVVVAAEGSLATTFFRGSSSVIAMFHQCGGLRAAVRSCLFLSVFALLVFMALVSAAGMPAAGVLAAALVFALQPTAVYHTHTPASEVLELLLVCGLGLCFCRRVDSAAAGWLGAGLMFAASVNRISFELFGALWICAASAADLGEPRRRAIASHVLLSAGLAAGIGYDLLAVPAALPKLGHVLPRIHAAAAGLLLAAAFMDLLSLRVSWRERLAAWSAWALVALVPVGAALALAGVAGWDPLEELRRNAVSLVPYFGIGALALAATGFVLLMLQARDRSALRFLAALLAAAVLVTLKQKHAADFYPWATKRFLSFGVPLAALASGVVAGDVWNRLRAGGRWVGGLLLALAATMIPQAWRAWNCASYGGVSAQLAEVAERVDPGDVIVADHFRWGMPLSFIAGRQVLNGERLWSAADPEAVRSAAEHLRALRADGARVWLLTTTDEGVLVFPRVMRSAAAPAWTSSFHYVETLQHPRASEFHLRVKEAHFALRPWEGE